MRIANGFPLGLVVQRTPKGATVTRTTKAIEREQPIGDEGTFLL